VNAPLATARPGGRARGVAWGAGIALVLAINAWARVSDYSNVFRSGEPIPLDGDSAYHLRRIAHGVAHGFSLPTFDPWLNWPRGAVCPWADGFDLLAVAFVRLLAAGRGAAAEAIAAALFTAALGLVSVWATIELARTVTPRAPGRESAVLAAGLIGGLYPPMIGIAQLGYADHHVIEVISLLFLATWALRRLGEAEPALPARPLAFEASGALAAAFAVWSFTGGAMYVAMVVPILVWAALRSTAVAFAGSGAPGLVAGAGLSLLLTLPSLRVHGRFLSFQLPSLLQPLLLLVAAGVVALAVLAAHAGASPWRRAGLLAALLAAATLGGVQLLPMAWRELAAGVSGWIFRRDPWIGSIVEFQPLALGATTPLDAYYLFGTTGVLAPAILAVAGVWLFRRGGERGVAFLALTLTVALFLFVQNRFARVLAPFLAVSVALALQALASAFCRGGGVRIAAAFPALAALALLGDPQLRVSLRPLRPRPVDPISSAALDLRDSTPPAASVGVLTPWDLGHQASLLSGRPTVVSGFGPYLDAATFAEVEEVWTRGPAELDAMLDRRRAAVVVGGAVLVPALRAGASRGPFRAEPRGLVLDLEFMRERPLATILIAGSGIPGAGIPHLEHLLPRFASAHRVASHAFDLPVLWTYEHVPGARLRGIAPPGARVVASVALQERGRLHQWRAFADAGPDGRWAMTVPVPTSLSHPTVRTGEAYELRIDGKPAAVAAVPEAAVLGGLDVWVPPLGSHPAR
jgi:dolichyl-diphosphooligosaccharide--protein glycosyltransferase